MKAHSCKQSEWKNYKLERTNALTILVIYFHETTIKKAMILSNLNNPNCNLNCFQIKKINRP